MNMI